MSLRVLYNLPQRDQQVIIFCLCFENPRHRSLGSTSLAIVTSSYSNVTYVSDKFLTGWLCLVNEYDVFDVTSSQDKRYYTQTSFGTAHLLF